MIDTAALPPPCVLNYHPASNPKVHTGCFRRLMLSFNGGMIDQERLNFLYFGVSVSQRRFYTFMASPSLPWERLWRVAWGMVPAPLTDGRVVVALDDFINPKVGRKIFGCESIFDHAAKSNQSKYPWAQNVVAVGLLKLIKDRWAQSAAGVSVLPAEEGH